MTLKESSRLFLLYLTITSSLYGKGKNKAWDTWMKSEMRDTFTFTDLFCRSGRTPVNLCKNDFNLVENFIIEMCSKTGKHTSLTTLRVETFKSSSYNYLPKLPSSSEALFQHTKRACYQAGYLCYLPVYMAHHVIILCAHIHVNQDRISQYLKINAIATLI